MKKNKRLFILLFVILGLWFNPGPAPAGERAQPFPTKGEAVEIASFSRLPVIWQGPLGQITKMSEAELDRIRGKGHGSIRLEDVSTSTNSRIILWDESGSTGKARIQEMNINSGIGGEQSNHLVFGNQ